MSGLLTPSGVPAGSIDKTMLLASWARRLQINFNHGNKPSFQVIIAGIGKPTFPINDIAAKAAVEYWQNLLSRSQELRHSIDYTNNDNQHTENTAITNDAVLTASLQSTENANCTASNTNLSLTSSSSELSAVVDYGDPQGDDIARQKMALALSNWYAIRIQPDNVLFTVGGAGGLHHIFAMLNKKFPNNIIVTPAPHYGLYSGSYPKNNLHLIDVMHSKGYLLTAELVATELNKAVTLAKGTSQRVSAFLLCDPNNPLGTSVNREEMLKIAEILRQYPEIIIILDEAYTEMKFTNTDKNASSIPKAFQSEHTSLLTLAPDLLPRIILLRSATKALSAAGERMAVLVAFDKLLMHELMQISVNTYGHAPRSSQIVFAIAMEQLDSKELNKLKSYYISKVLYVVSRLQKMGASLPDPNYKITGTFYTLADLSDLMGLELPASTRIALNKTGNIETDEDLCYYLLFQDKIMLAPLSYCGIIYQTLGYVRITCSEQIQTLEILMDRMENRLVYARKIKQDKLINKITSYIKNTNQSSLEHKLNKILLATDNGEKHGSLSNKNTAKSLALVLKEVNLQLSSLIEQLETTAVTS